MHGTLKPPQLVTLEHLCGCHWPVKRGNGGASPWLFCDQPQVTGRPYCAEHCTEARAERPRKTTNAVCGEYVPRFKLEDA